MSHKVPFALSRLVLYGDSRIPWLTLAISHATKVNEIIPKNMGPRMNIRFQPKLRLITLISLSIILTACGGGSDESQKPPTVVQPGNGNNEDEVLSGQLIDGPIAGFNYETDSQSGITGADGMFQYKGGETISFSIGDYPVANDIQPGQLLTPYELMHQRLYVSNFRVINFTRFLQTIDRDRNPENGIDIDHELVGAALVAFQQEKDEIENSLDLFNKLEYVEGVIEKINEAGDSTEDLEIVSVEDALNHLNKSIRKYSQLLGLGSPVPVMGASDGSGVHTSFASDNASLAIQWFSPVISEYYNAEVFYDYSEHYFSSLSNDLNDVFIRLDDSLTESPKLKIALHGLDIANSAILTENSELALNNLGLGFELKHFGEGDSQNSIKVLWDSKYSLTTGGWSIFLNDELLWYDIESLSPQTNGGDAFEIGLPFEVLNISTADILDVSKASIIFFYYDLDSLDVVHSKPEITYTYQSPILLDYSKGFDYQLTYRHNEEVIYQQYEGKITFNNFSPISYAEGLKKIAWAIEYKSKEKTPPGLENIWEFGAYKTTSLVGDSEGNSAVGEEVVVVSSSQEQLTHQDLAQIFAKKHQYSYFEDGSIQTHGSIGLSLSEVIANGGILNTMSRDDGTLLINGKSQCQFLSGLINNHVCNLDGNTGYVLQPTDEVTFELIISPPNSLGDGDNDSGFFLPSSLHKSKLNDTGITTCANDSLNGLACPVDDYSGQDGEVGRDALNSIGGLEKIGGGNAGFDFTKLDANGNILNEDAIEWSCVRDNHTGLIWEVKTNDFGLQHKGNRYKWYNPDNTTNGGNVGFENDGANTYQYVLDINERGLCGAKDWFLPSVEQLRSIASYGQLGLDESYFPNTKSLGYSGYWSSTTYAKENERAWLAEMNGNEFSSLKDNAEQVRLVRIAE